MYRRLVDVVRKPLPYIIIAVTLGSFYLLESQDYSFFSLLAGLLRAGVAFSVFAVSVSCRRFLKDGFFPIVGVGYLFVGVLDMLYFLTYFSPTEVGISNHIWLASRLIEAVTLLFASLYIGKPTRLPVIAAGYAALSSVLLFAIFLSDIFPRNGNEWHIPFNVASELAISTLLIFSVGLFWLRRNRFESMQIRLVTIAIVLTITSELSFDIIDNTNGFLAFSGHFFKLSSFILIFGALINRGINQPVDNLVHHLYQSRETVLVSERRFQTLFDNMMDGFAYQKIITNDRGEAVDAVFIEMNPAFERLSGLSGECTVGRRFSEIFPNISIKDIDWFASFGEVGLKRDEKQFECCFELVPGRPKRWYKGLAFSPEANHVAVVLEDINNEKKSEENRREMDIKLQYSEKQESLRMLAGGVAHDFNNLLTGVLANADLAELESSDPIICDFLKQIKSAANQAADLSRQMLAYSGGGRFEVAPIQLSETLEEIRELIQVTLPKSIGFYMQLCHPLPLIKADVVQIRQMVMSLITNAAEAVGDLGEILIKTSLVTLTSSDLSNLYFHHGLKDGPHVMFTIRDTGCGIPTDLIQKIFDPFFSTKFMGRGLGLASTLGIVRRHHGGIQIESHEGKGTQINLYFPVAESRPARTISEIPVDQGWQGSGLVLVADDEPFVRLTTTAMLEKMGFQAVAVSDGVEALRRFKKESTLFDLVILDLSMPDMGGEAVLNEIRKIRCAVPVLLASGYNETVIQYDLESDPYTEFTQKPFGIKHLRERVQSLLRNRPHNNERPWQDDVPMQQS